MSVPQSKLSLIVKVIIDSLASSLKVAPEELGKAVGNISGDDLSDIIETMAKLLIDPAILTELVAGKIHTGDLSTKIRVAITDTLDDPNVRELAESIGSLITTPFVSIMEEYASHEDISGIEFASAFHGTTSLLTLVGMFVSLLETQVLGFKLGPISSAFNSLYWNLGLGFLGWQTLAPLLSAGLQPKLTRHYNKLYAPNQLPLDYYIYQYYSGEITSGQLIDKGREQGWSSGNVENIVRWGYRTLTRSDMKDLYSTGVMSISEISDELLKQGFNPRHVPSLTKFIINETVEEGRLPSLSLARKAYKEGLYNTQQFISILDGLGYGQQAINLEIALAQQELLQQAKELTISQVKQAYAVGEISEQDVRLYLASEDYNTSQIDILVNTWSAAKKPKILKLNKGTITSALVKGVIDVGEASARLGELGYTTDLAQIIIDTALSGGGVSGHVIPISKLLQAYSIGAITQIELEKRLRGRNVSESDIQIYIDVANHQDVKELSEVDIKNAYLYGAIDESKTRDNLSKIHYESDNIEFLVQAWNRQKETFKIRLTPGLAILYYRQGLISSDELRRKLIELGFSDSDAELMVQSADLAYPRELTNNEIQDLYFTGVINDDKATTLLQQTGLDAVNAQLVIQSWQKALANIRPQPTVSQFLAAFRDELLTENELVQKLRDKGYDDKAIAFYVRLAKEKEIEVTKSLTKADILGLYEDDLLTYDESLTRLIDQGYSAEDSELLLARRKPEIRESQAHKLFMAGYIDPVNYVEILLGLGYSPDDIDEYLTSIGF